MLAEHAEFHVNINSVVGGGIKNPNDALVISKRALELGFESTIGIIHDGDGQLKPLKPDEARVYQEMKARKKGNYAQFDKFQEAIAEGRANDWRCRAGSRYLYVCEDGLVHYCSQQRGYPGIPVAEYSRERLKQEFLTAKSCAPNCTIGCVHRISHIDHWRAPQTRMVAPGGQELVKIATGQRGAAVASSANAGEDARAADEPIEDAKRNKGARGRENLRARRMAFAGADAVFVCGGKAGGLAQIARSDLRLEGGQGEVRRETRRSISRLEGEAGERRLLSTVDFGEGLVDELVEAAAVYDFDKRRRVGGAGDDPDGGRVLNADALAQIAVILDLLREPAHGIDGERQCDAVLGRKLLRELLEIDGSLNGRLVGEDFVAVFVAEGLAFGVEEAGVDGGLEAPVVLRQGEVVADPWDVVFGRGVFEEWVGAGAVRALKVFKLDDGDASAGRRLEGRRVVDLGGIGRAKLGVGRDGDHGGEGNGK